MAMVAPGEFYDFVSPRVGAGNPDGAHGGLRAGVHQPKQLHGGHGRVDKPGQLHLALSRSTEGRTAGRPLLHRHHHSRMGVAQDERSPGADVVDVFVAVHVPDAGALATPDEGRLATHGAEGADGAVHPAGDEGLGLGEERVGNTMLHLLTGPTRTTLSSFQPKVARTISYIQTSCSVIGRPTSPPPASGRPPWHGS